MRREPEIQASYPATNDQIAPSLGRNLAACGTRTVCTATAAVPLIGPQTQFEGRRTQLDLRVSKIFRVGPRARLQANFDVYNALNASPVMGLIGTYGSRWQQPAATSRAGAILDARLIQFSGQLIF